MFHGTDLASGGRLLQGEVLDAAKAAAAKIDGPPGFFLATHADDAVYFAARRGGGILEYRFSEVAVKALGGLPTTPLGPLGRFGRFLGNEAVVPVTSFETFNKLRTAGEIVVVPFR
jgi:hypothetical protein